MKTPRTALDAVILDYNGVIGRQPSTDQWRHLARVAAWPDDLASFQNAFWSAREAYDAGQLSDLAFWAQTLGWHPGPRMLRELRAADTAMWTRTDDRVLAVLQRAQQGGLPMVLLSNAPHPLSDVLDTTDWCRQLMTRALYSARLEVCKPAPAAYLHALEATGASEPHRVLFIDDRDDNCQAAESLGLRTLHHTGQIADLEAALLQTPA
ncbi:HAD-IA family hydrolase [Streptomyces ureilyticus]|uniref:HAD-IA family hydrolase n=1 Tax=Streptomyces ureilyticus TaxID=1775131 RepID=A0ABX0E5R1_9ACTN|nr:HAD-IA family hydrolase [Streptomyces ureilyticus]NGO49540.1 HAD-IA family hydrolase [Streptomyces ureilyticus]